MIQNQKEKLSEYELKRLQQIAQNQYILQKLELGLSSTPNQNEMNDKKNKTKSKKKVMETRSLRQSTLDSRPKRYQLRDREALADAKLKRKENKKSLFIRNEPKYSHLKYKIWDKGNVFGHIPGIPVGATWETRMDCGRNGVHRSVVGGIHGTAKEGCYSLALSGGYEDDIDFGETFIYTGSGGRDLKGTKANPKNLRTAPQSSDQTFTGFNAALKLSFENQKPIRVIRGYKLKSEFAPKEGYRYDGLYKVIRCWQEKGKSGFKVCRFELKRLPHQPPLLPNP